MAKLKQHDGRDVRGVRIKVTNTGDGLSNAMKVEPQELHIGEKVFVVMETTVSADGHEPVSKDSDDLALVYRLKAGTAAIVDEAVVRSALADMAARVQRMRDEETGQQSMNLDPLNVDDTKPKEVKAIKAAPAKKAPAKKATPRKRTTKQ
jgi:hypothetical protein